MKKILITCLTAIISVFAIAQPVTQPTKEDSNRTKVLEEVVVTGQYKPQSVKNSVYQVKVISKERIQQQAATKLQDVLNSELNIRFGQDLATGGSNISMLGLSGQNVKILLDGVPMVGRQGTSNEININQIDVNSIERIEIIEGPLSVVYGADALAGVINIITKKPSSQKLSVTARLHEESIGKEYGFDQGIHNQYTSISWNYKNWLIGGGIGRNLFNGWQGDTTGRELTWHKKDQIVANALLGYRTNRWSVYYRLDGLDEIITNPSNISGSQPATDQDYITDRLMQQLQGNFTFNGKLSANAVASYTHFTRQVYSTLYYPNGDIRVSTAPGTHSLNTFDGSTVRATVVYKPSSIISFQPGVDVNSENGEGERVKDGEQRITDYAFFITSEITPVKWMNLRPGFRFIKNSVYEAPPVVPSINTKFSLAKKLDLRLAYARGFRAPSIRELYFDFRDASHDILGNDQLEAETSNSYTGSLAWRAYQRDGLTISTTITGFYNDVDNMITYAQSANDPRVTTYTNIDHYKTRGTTLSGELKYKNFNASIGVSYIAYYNQYAEADKSLPEFTNSAEVNSIITYSFKKAGLDLNLFYKFTGKRPYYLLTSVSGQSEVIQAETEGYNWMDFTMNKKLFRYFILNAGIRNLMNITTVNNSAIISGAHSSAGAIPIGYGRSFFAGLVFNWEK